MTAYILVQEGPYWDTFDTLAEAEREADYLWSRKTEKEKASCEIFQVCECDDLDDTGMPLDSWNPDEHIVRDYVAEHIASEETMDVYFTHSGKVYKVEVPANEDDVWQGIADYDDEHGTDLWDRLRQDDVLGVNLGAEYPGAEPVTSWDDVEGGDVTVVTATKKIGPNGTGLAILVTKEVRMLGLDRGDLVEVTLRRIRQ